MELRQIETVGDLVDELWRIDRALIEKYKEHAPFYIDGEPALANCFAFRKEKIDSTVALQYQKSVRPLSLLCTAQGLDFTIATIDRLRSQLCLNKCMPEESVANLPIADFVSGLRSPVDELAAAKHDSESPKERDYDPGPDAGPYSPKQAAHRLGISPSKVYELCRNHVLAHERIDRRIVIRREHLEEYRAEYLLRDQRQGSASGFRHL